MKPVSGSPAPTTTDRAKVRRLKRERAAVSDALYHMERRNPSVTELCPGCGRHTCWLGAWATSAGGARRRVRPFAVTDAELLELRRRRRRYLDLIPAILVSGGY